MMKYKLRAFPKEFIIEVLTSGSGGCVRYGPAEACVMSQWSGSGPDVRTVSARHSFPNERYVEGGLAGGFWVPVELLEEAKDTA